MDCTFCQVKLEVFWFYLTEWVQILVDSPGVDKLRSVPTLLYNATMHLWMRSTISTIEKFDSKIVFLTLIIKRAEKTSITPFSVCFGNLNVS